jgi:hypothetical protein
LRPPSDPTARVLTQRTYRDRCLEAADPPSLERTVRQLLADKISGTLVGLWLLVPEHLRLGTWDLLRTWTGQPTPQVQPRLALQLVHEAALCVTGIRHGRGLSQRGFEVANGLPFVATDTAVHDLLDAHTVAEARTLQTALGLVRRARGHFRGARIAIDPHRVRSWSQRQMRRHRSQHHQEESAHKVAQTFFAVDVDTHEPLGLTTATASRTVSQATPELLDLIGPIVPPPAAGGVLVLADGEHFTTELITQLRRRSGWDLLVPLPNHAARRKQLAGWPETRWTRRWAGFATAKAPLTVAGQPLWLFAQRCGERPDQYVYKSFASTRDGDEVQTLTDDFPRRWHIEEFFDAHQALGWKRAGTLNLNVRYGQMSLALVAQAALSQLRQRLGEPYRRWEADQFATRLLGGLDGDVRVEHDTIVVTFYNAPAVESLRAHYAGLPDKLSAEGVDPHIPWLFNFKLDFRFK